MLWSVHTELLSWIPFVHDLYGLVGAWCWIKEWRHDCASHHYPEGIIEQFVLWYGPLFVSLTIVLIGFLIIPIVLAWRAYQINAFPEREHLLHNDNMKEAVKRMLPLLAYPVIFFVLALFPLVNRVYSAISHHASYGLTMAHSVTQSSWSFFSSLALIVHIFLIRQFVTKRKQAPGRKKSVNGYETFYVFTSATSENYTPPEEDDVESD